MLTCDQCGRSFVRWNRKGRNPLRCSDECRQLAIKKLHRQYPRSGALIDPKYTRRERTCPVCGVRWSNIVGNGPRKYCSERCRDAATKGLRNPKDRIPCSQGCGATLPGGAFQLFGFRRWCGECDRTRPHALPARVRRRIYERDDWVCQLCDKPVDPDDCIDGIVGPNYPTVDHIVPRSVGGSDSEENLRLAHHQCNSERGVALNEQLAWAV